MFRVENLKTTTICPEIVLNSLRIRNNTGEERHVYQLRFLGWPDHGVPDDSRPVRMLVHLVQAAQRRSNPSPDIPIVAHCSAGVGRSGTLIMLDTMFRRLDRGDDTVDVFATALKLREQRVMMLQTVAQYIFCYRAIGEELLDPSSAHVPIVEEFAQS
eukprot:Rmarinus@m.5422